MADTFDGSIINKHLANCLSQISNEFFNNFDETIQAKSCETIGFILDKLLKSDSQNSVTSATTGVSVSSSFTQTECS